MTDTTPELDVEKLMLPDDYIIRRVILVHKPTGEEWPYTYKYLGRQEAISHAWKVWRFEHKGADDREWVLKYD